MLPKKHHCECGHVITWEVVGRPGVVIAFWSIVLPSLATKQQNQTIWLPKLTKCRKEANKLVHSCSFMDPTNTTDYCWLYIYIITRLTLYLITHMQMSIGLVNQFIQIICNPLQKSTECANITYQYQYVYIYISYNYPNLVFRHISQSSALLPIVSGRQIFFAPPAASRDEAIAIAVEDLEGFDQLFLCVLGRFQRFS